MLLLHVFAYLMFRVCCVHRFSPLFEVHLLSLRLVPSVMCVVSVCVYLLIMRMHDIGFIY